MQYCALRIISVLVLSIVGCVPFDNILHTMLNPLTINQENETSIEEIISGGGIGTKIVPENTESEDDDDDDDNSDSDDDNGDNNGNNGGDGNGNGNENGNGEENAEEGSNPAPRYSYTIADFDMTPSCVVIAQGEKPAGSCDCDPTSEPNCHIWHFERYVTAINEKCCEQEQQNYPANPELWEHCDENNQHETFTWEIASPGAHGSDSALKMHVFEGVPYFYFKNNDKNAYITSGAAFPVNRMRFSIKFPEGWRAPTLETDYYNFNVGTYHRDPNIRGDQETHGWHFYYQPLFDAFDDEWITLDLSMWSQHVRARDWNPGINPIKPLANFFEHLSRIYFTGYPYCASEEELGFSIPEQGYDVWFDDWEFYYENQYVAVQPEYYEKNIRVNEYTDYSFEVFNNHETESRTFGIVESSFTEGAHYWAHEVSILESNESGPENVIEEIILEPRTSKKLIARVRAPGDYTYDSGAFIDTETSVYQKEPAWLDDLHIRTNNINGYPNFGIKLGTPAASLFIRSYVTNDNAIEDSIPPSAITNLMITKIWQNSVELSWTASGDDENSGRAYAYDIRYLGEEITFENFDSALPFSEELAPLHAGSRETYIVPPQLDSNKAYCFAIKTYDESYSLGVLSNNVCARTLKEWTEEEHAANQIPRAVIDAEVTSGDSPLRVLFSSEDSTDPDGSIVLTLWDFDDGFLSTDADPEHTFYEIGTHDVSLTVVDDKGDSHTEIVSIIVDPGETGIIRLQNGFNNYTGTAVYTLQEANPDAVLLNRRHMLGYYAGRNHLIAYFADPFNLLPQGSQIVKAELHVYETSINGVEGFEIEGYPIKRTLGAGRVTWNHYDTSLGIRGQWDEPGAEGDDDVVYNGFDIRVSLDPIIGWKSLDLTELASDWLEGKKENNGIMLKIKDEPTEETRYADFASIYDYSGENFTDETFWPILKIEYEVE